MSGKKTGFAVRCAVCDQTRAMCECQQFHSHVGMGDAVPPKRANSLSGQKPASKKLSMTTIYQSTIDTLIARATKAELDKSAALINFERVTAERDALQLRLTVADQRVDELETVRASLVGKVTQCKACGSDDLFWYSHIHNHSSVQHNRLNTNDVTCLLMLGCNDCSETLMTVKADRIAERMTAALNPATEAASHDE